MANRIVEIYGMPRSGTTIVASFINSLPGSLIVGEPHRAVNEPRPHGLESVPSIYNTQYGDLFIYPGIKYSVLDQIRRYAATNNCHTYGFKECWTPASQPYFIMGQYHGEYRETRIRLFVFRDPYITYQSVLDNMTEFPSIKEFNVMYKLLADCALDSNPNRIVLLDMFRENPIRVMQVVLSTSIDELPYPLVQFPGNGDIDARWSRIVEKEETGVPYTGIGYKGLLECETVYRKMVSVVGEIYSRC